MIRNYFDEVGLLSVMTGIDPSCLSKPTTSWREDLNRYAVSSKSSLDPFTNMIVSWTFSGIARYLRFWIIFSEREAPVFYSQLTGDVDGEYNGLPPKTWCPDEWGSMLLKLRSHEQWEQRYETKAGSFTPCSSKLNERLLKYSF